MEHATRPPMRGIRVWRRRFGNHPLWLLILRVWLTVLIPTRSEVRLGLLAGGVAFLAVVALSPLVGWLLG